MEDTIIRLGQKLIEEFDSGDNTDTLSRWMAFYVAQQIEIVNESPDNEDAKTKCFETILKLWEHRASFQKNNRPFSSFEPVFRALERMDPEREFPGYFSIFQQAKEDVPKEVKKWLDMALIIDEAARVCIKFLFKEAAKSVSNEKTIEWLTISSGLLEEEVDIQAIKFIRYGDSLEHNVSEDKVRESSIKALERRMKQLKSFIEMSKEIYSGYQSEIEELLKDS